MSLDVLAPVDPTAVRRFVVRPTASDRLAAEGFSTCADFFRVAGPIIGGHPGRHVLRLTIGGRDRYLKREHRVTWRDRLASWRAGFGFVSVSVREALTLDELRRHGISAPRWLAMGELHDGRAFVLLEGIENSESLRHRLQRTNGSPTGERRRLAQRLGSAIAAIHHAGIRYPDMYAKHVLIDRIDGSFTFLDWQRTSRSRRLTVHERCRDLAALDASLPDELADADSRLTLMIAYWRSSSHPNARFDNACQLIRQRSAKLQRRGSLREQRLPSIAQSQALYWWRGEELCVTETGRELLDEAELDRIVAEAQESIVVNGIVCALTMSESSRPIAALWDIIRGRNWQSPESRRAANMLRSERLGEAPRLLAFGQRRVSFGVVRSFLLCLREATR